MMVIDCSLFLGGASIFFFIGSLSITCGSSSASSGGDLLSWLFYDSHHLLFELLTLSEKTIFVPAEVRDGKAELVTLHAGLEQGENVAVIWVLGERQSAAVVHELFEFFRLVQTEVVKSHLLLLSLDCSVLLVFGASRKALPGERAAQEVDENVTDCLEIVSSALFIANMRGNRGISSCTSEVLAFTEGDMLTLRVLVAFSESEIDNINIVLCAFLTANKEVIRFDISVDDPLLMNFLNSLYLQTCV